MADDADLLITAGFSDAKLAAEMKKVEAKFAQAGEKAQKAFNQSAEKAVANSQVVKANAREIDNLKRKYDPLYAASKRYEAELDKLNRAQAVGAINAKQHAAALDRLNADLETGGRAMGGLAQSSRGFGNTMQNAGYQIQDFAVQVASGTDASRAFAQQFPQMASAFGPWGVGIGTAAAVLVPLAAAMLGGADAGEVLDDKIEALTESTDSYVSAAEAARTSVSELTLRYGGLADEVARANAAMASIASIRAQSDAIGASRSLSGALGIDMSALSRDQSSIPAGANIDRIRVEMQALEDAQADVLGQMQDKLGATAEQADLLRMALNRTNSSNSLQAVAADAENLLGIVSDLYISADDEQRRFLDGWAAQIAATMNAAKQQIAAGIAEEARLTETYDQNSQKLAKLAEDRASAERLLAQAVIDGNQEKIDSYTRIIEAVDGEVVAVKTAIAEIDGSLDEFIERMKARAGEIGGGFGDAMRSYLGFDFAEFGKQSEAAQKGIRELIKSVESGGDYNITLDNGAYSGGPRDLVNMTLNEVLAMQKQMLAHPDNTKNSSAAGAYQIVSTTLKSLIQELGLSGNELFSVEMQDRMADQLLRRRRGQGIEGLRNEWEGLRGVSPAVINQAMGQQSIERVDPEVAKRESDILKEQATAMQRKLDLVKQFGEQLSANLLTEQQTAELAKQRAEQIAAINAQDISDEDKAAAIAQVNAEMDRQTTILKLLEEAKRRNVDLDAQMAGSTLTYRQAIEQLGAAQYAQSLASQEAKRGTEEFSDAQKFATDQQRAFEEGFVDAILSADNFGDALKNLAAQLLLTAAKAQLMKSLFNSGPLGGGGGGGLLGGILGSLFPSANGNAFINGSPVKAFANGGVVSSPTTFPMRNGIGLMGEAGPEAIMPLTRLANGKLGVQADGSARRIESSSITMTIDLRGTTGDRELDAKIALAGRQILAQVPSVMDDVNKRTR